MSEHIDYTNSQHRWRHVITRFNIAGRKKFYRAFMDQMAPSATMSILDVGVTPDQSAADSNFFEKWYPHPECITATSIEDASHLESLHPGLTFVQTSGDGLPFEDDHFDIAFSTAVIEHVGDRERQRQFLAELLRVSKRFFITTPNRWYPVELHTYVPFLHWLPQHRHQEALRRSGQGPVGHDREPEPAGPAGAAGAVPAGRHPDRDRNQAVRHALEPSGLRDISPVAVAPARSVAVLLREHVLRALLPARHRPQEIGQPVEVGHHQ